jgi:RNA polymerase nonessential primary-like sigma factor
LLDSSSVENNLTNKQRYCTMIQLANRMTTSSNTIQAYLGNIGRIPLLERSQEIEYGQQIQLMLKFQQARLDLMAQSDCEPSQEDWAANLELTIDELESAIEAGKLAKLRMVEANLRLVVTIAKQYQHCNLDFLDLIQEGAIGLQRGAEKYDPTKGYRFSTYAYWWIRQAMTRAISQGSRTIRLPIHLVEILNRIRRVERELTQEFDRVPTVEEVAEALHLKPQMVREYLSHARRTLSLEKPLGQNSESKLQDLLMDNAALPIDRAERNELSQKVREAIEKLPRTMREVLVNRFGLDDGDPRSLAEVGKRMGMSRERVRQLQQKAFNIIRQRDSGIQKHLAS